MTDYFAEFGFPRRPALDEGGLREKYLQLAARLHPDAAGGDEEKFRGVQTAYKILGDSAARLRHLAELEFGGLVADKTLPPQDLFLRVAGTLQQAKDVLRRRDAARTALARALLADDIGRARAGVKETEKAVTEEKAMLTRELATLDAKWPACEPGELRGLAARMTFVSRWISELMEVSFKLEHGTVGS